MSDKFVQETKGDASLENDKLGEDDRLDDDRDGDGLTALEELRFGSDPNNADTDGDGLNDWAEQYLGTDPRNHDTDGDGLTDGDEVRFGMGNPAVADTDGDGLSDYDEQTSGGRFDPLNPDSDGDGIADGDEDSFRKMTDEEIDRFGFGNGSTSDTALGTGNTAGDEDDESTSGDDVIGDEKADEALSFDAAMEDQVDVTDTAPVEKFELLDEEIDLDAGHPDLDAEMIE